METQSGISFTITLWALLFILAGICAFILWIERRAYKEGYNKGTEDTNKAIIKDVEVFLENKEKLEFNAQSLEAIRDKLNQKFQRDATVNN